MQSTTIDLINHLVRQTTPVNLASELQTTRQDAVGVGLGSAQAVFDIASLVGKEFPAISTGLNLAGLGYDLNRAWGYYNEHGTLSDNTIQGLMGDIYGLVGGVAVIAGAVGAAPVLVGIGAALTIAGAGFTLASMTGNESDHQIVDDFRNQMASLNDALGDAYATAVNATADAMEVTTNSISGTIDAIAHGLEGIGNFFVDLEKGVSQSIADFFNSAFNFVMRRDPLVLDLDGDGIETVGAASTNPILFDHDNDGIRTGTGWIKSDDGLLVLDRNNNGTIDNGGELFGDSTSLAGGGMASDGFAALADMDSNHDGVVSSADANFAALRVWRDLNQDGISQSNELFALNSLNIASINVAHTDVTQNQGNGNTITAVGSFTHTDGSTATIGGTNLGDANLVEDTFHRQFTDHIPLAAGVNALPNMQGSGKVRDLWEAVSLFWEIAA